MPEKRIRISVDGIDRHAGHADIAGDPSGIGIIATMGGQVEGDGKAGLPGRQIAAVKGVGLFRRRESGILPDGPGLPAIHGGIGSAQKRRQAGIGVQKIDTGPVGLAVTATQRDAFGRFPHDGSLRRRHIAGAIIHVAKIRDAAHGAATLCINPSLQRVQHAARRFDGLEFFPGQGAKILRQILKGAATGGRIRDVRKVGFGLQNQRNIARQAPRIAARKPSREIMRQNRNRIRPTCASGKGG